jgi:MFS family permease
MFMAMLDMSVVTVALPVIEHDLHTTTDTSEWVVLGYLLSGVALTLPAGRWLDSVGTRPALVLATGGFAAASVAAGAATDIGWLVAARVAQGGFGAVLFALAPALAATAVRPEVRGRAMGLIATFGPLGAVSGPALGGLAVETVGWSWIFYANVPVALVVITIARAQLPAGPRLLLPDRGWLGEAALIGSAAFAVMLGLSLAAGHGYAWLALVPAAAPLLLWWWHTPTSRTIRDLAHVPGLAGPHTALLAFAAGTGIVQFLTPFFLLRVLNVPAGTAGAILLAMPLAMVASGLVGGVLADRVGARRTALGGALLLVLGLLLLTPLGSDWAAGDLVWRMGLVGAGAGLFNAPNLTLAMSSAPPHRLDTVGATTSLAHQVGFALGPALATVMWAASGYTPTGMRIAVGAATALTLTILLALIGRRSTRPVSTTT